MRPSMPRTPQVNQGKRTASGAMRTRLSRDNSNAVKKTSNSMAWGITIISAISLALTLISPFLVTGVLIFAVILISIVPMFGTQLGTLYFRKFVISPATCEPVRAHAALLQVLSTPRKKNVPVVSTANCVALFKDATRVAIGRVVVSTPAAIVLFEPLSGSTQRVPIGELTVQVVDHVPAINHT